MQVLEKATLFELEVSSDPEFWARCLARPNKAIYIGAGALSIKESQFACRSMERDRRGASPQEASLPRLLHYRFMISLVETVLLNEHGALWSDFSSNLSAWLGFEFHGPSMKVRMFLAL
jgi:hypothetical protein